MGRSPRLFTEKKDDNVLFIFDLNSITGYRDHLSLSIFSQFVGVFKDVIPECTFKYIPQENLIICDSIKLTVEYMNSLKEKIKVEREPIFIEEAYNFDRPLRHIDIANSEMKFINKYRVDSKLLCSTFVSYDTRTIIIKSLSANGERTIPHYAARLIESCLYIPDGANMVTNLPVKYPYRDMIKAMFSTDFVSRTMAVSIPKEEEVKVDFTTIITDNGKYYTPSPEDKNVANSLKALAKEDFDKFEDKGYEEVFDSITEEQVDEFFERSMSLLDVPVRNKKVVNLNLPSTHALYQSTAENNSYLSDKLLQSRPF